MSGFAAIRRPKLLAIRPGAKYSRRLSVAGYQWAKEVKPMQPGRNCQLTISGSKTGITFKRRSLCENYR